MTIFNYTDYRLFLKDEFSALQHKNKHLSMREILRRIGCVSPSYFKETVMDAKKNMGVSMARKIAAFLKLDKNEAEYFITLVNFNQSKTESERVEYYEQLIRLGAHGASESRFLSGNEYGYLSSWEIPAIRELLKYHPNFGNRSKEERKLLIDKFLPKITEEQIQQAMSILESLGFVQKDANGNFRKTDQNIRSVEKTPAAYSLLCQNLKLAQEIINIAPSRSRIFKALMVSTSSQAYQLIEKKTNEYCKEILDIVTNDKSPEDRLYSLGVQLFPLTKLPEEKRQ
jgi:uncharacterized protein (TIGR02147 family)